MKSLTRWLEIFSLSFKKVIHIKLFEYTDTNRFFSDKIDLRTINLFKFGSVEFFSKGIHIITLKFFGLFTILVLFIVVKKI